MPRVRTRRRRPGRKQGDDGDDGGSDEHEAPGEAAPPPTDKPVSLFQVVEPPGPAMFAHLAQYVMPSPSKFLPPPAPAADRPKEDPWAGDMPWHTERPPAAAAAGYLTAADAEETAVEGLEGEGGADGDDGEGVVVKKKRNRRRKRGIKKKGAAAAAALAEDEGLEVDNLLQSDIEFFDGDDQVNLNDVLETIVSKKREIDRLEALLREAKASIDEQSVIVRRAIRVKKAGELSEVEGGPEPARRVTPKPAEEESPKSGKEVTPEPAEEVTPEPAPAAEPIESAPEAVEDAGDDPKHGGEADDEEDGDAVEEDEESDGPPPLPKKKTRRGLRKRKKLRLQAEREAAEAGLDAQEEEEEEEEDEEQKSHEPADQYSILCTAQELKAMGYVPEDVESKIKYCGHYLKGKCYYGASCKFRHPEKELKPKTKKVLEICRHFYDGLVHPDSRGCTFGNQCRYLHDFGSFAAHLVERGDAQEMEKDLAQFVNFDLDYDDVFSNPEIATRVWQANDKTPQKGPASEAAADLVAQVTRNLDALASKADDESPGPPPMMSPGADGETPPHKLIPMDGTSPGELPLTDSEGEDDDVMRQEFKRHVDGLFAEVHQADEKTFHSEVEARDDTLKNVQDQAPALDIEAMFGDLTDIDANVDPFSSGGMAAGMVGKHSAATVGQAPGMDECLGGLDDSDNDDDPGQLSAAAKPFMPGTAAAGGSSALNPSAKAFSLLNSAATPFVPPGLDTSARPFVPGSLPGALTTPPEPVLSLPPSSYQPPMNPAPSVSVAVDMVSSAGPSPVSQASSQNMQIHELAKQLTEGVPGALQPAEAATEKRAEAATDMLKEAAADKPADMHGEKETAKENKERSVVDLLAAGTRAQAQDAPVEKDVVELLTAAAPAAEARKPPGIDVMEAVMASSAQKNEHGDLPDRAEAILASAREVLKGSMVGPAMGEAPKPAQPTGGVNVLEALQQPPALVPMPTTMEQMGLTQNLPQQALPKQPQLLPQPQQQQSVQQELPPLPLKQPQPPIPQPPKAPRPAVTLPLPGPSQRANESAESKQARRAKALSESVMMLAAANKACVKVIAQLQRCQLPPDGEMTQKMAPTKAHDSLEALSSVIDTNIELHNIVHKVEPPEPAARDNRSSLSSAPGSVGSSPRAGEVPSAPHVPHVVRSAPAQKPAPAPVANPKPPQQPQPQPYCPPGVLMNAATMARNNESPLMAFTVAYTTNRRLSSIPMPQSMAIPPGSYPPPNPYARRMHEPHPHLHPQVF